MTPQNTRKYQNTTYYSALPPATLQLDVQSREWLHADHVVHDSCCVRVVCAIVEFVDGACRVLKALVPGDKQRKKSLLSKAYLCY